MVVLIVRDTLWRQGSWSQTQMQTDWCFATLLFINLTKSRVAWCASLFQLRTVYLRLTLFQSVYSLYRQKQPIKRSGWACWPHQSNLLSRRGQFRPRSSINLLLPARCRSWRRCRRVLTSAQTLSHSLSYRYRLGQHTCCSCHCQWNWLVSSSNS